MKMLDIQVEVSGFDNWDNPIQPYKKHVSIQWKPHYTIGSDTLYDINTRQINTIVAILGTREQHFNCNVCQDWGCHECCNTDEEIRNKQGMFS